MMRRILGRKTILAVLLLLVVLALYAAYTRQVKAASQFVAVAPVYWFGIEAVLPAEYRGVPFTVQDAAATEADLVVLLRSAGPPADYSLLLRMTALGRYISSSKVSAGVAPLVRTDGAENAVLLLREQGRMRLLICGRGGEVTRSFIVDEPIRDVVEAPDGLFAIWSGGVKHLANHEPARAETMVFSQHLPTFLSAALPGSRFALLDRRDARLNVVSMLDLSEHSVLIEDPEIVKPPPPPPPLPGSEPMAIKNVAYALASDAGGNLYVALTGHPLSSGAVVLQVAPDGKVLKRFRFSLPSLEALRTAWNPAGYVFPGKLLLSGDLAVWIDRGKSQAAVYRLPR